MDETLEQKLDKERHEYFESTKNEVYPATSPFICEHRAELMAFLQLVVGRIPNAIIAWFGSQALKYIDDAIKQRCGQK